MTQLAFTRRGTGAPLVLLHPLGLSRRVWDPIMPALTELFDVIAVDLPGFGDSKPMPEHVTPTPAALAACVASFLDDLGITTPHVAGNSLGGWVALELAALRPVASLALLSPAGLWLGKTPRYCRITLGGQRFLARRLGGVLSRLVASRSGRLIVLGQTHGHPTRVHPAYARVEIRELGTCAGFDATMKATLPLAYQAGSPVAAPVTVAFGTRDLVLLPRQSRHVERLPFGTHVVSLPGCGHVPMPDDPDAVAALIVRVAARAPVAPPPSSSEAARAPVAPPAVQRSAEPRPGLTRRSRGA